MKVLATKPLHDFFAVMFLMTASSLLFGRCECFQNFAPFRGKNRYEKGTSNVILDLNVDSSGPKRRSSSHAYGVCSETINTQYSNEARSKFTAPDEPPPGPSAFVGEPTKLFLEDTDDYGVLFNGFYIRAYEQALRQLQDCVREAHGGNTRGLSVLSHEDFYVARCSEHTFSSSPILGECTHYAVRGNLVEAFANGEETWRLEMMRYEEHQTGPQTVYNSALLTIAIPQHEFLTQPRSKSLTTQNEQSAYVQEPLNMPRNSQYNPPPIIFPEEAIVSRSRRILCIEIDNGGGLVVSEELRP